MPALIDTGAARTVLTPDAIERVGLPVVDYTSFTRAGGEDKATAHVASIRFPGSPLSMIEVVQVLCCALPGGLYQCLIGRDILSRWLFSYNGKIGYWFIDEEDLPTYVEPPEGLFY
jgi:predicted aspartyl protease